MRVRFLAHSGFYVEGDQNCFLFDYWKGDLPQVPTGKHLWIFASHHHPDHYDAKIFEFGESASNTHYFLGCDITLNTVNRQKMGITDNIHSRCHRMHKDNILTMDGISVRTIRSTDMGVAFIVESEGKRIYHAGDHNLWIWHEDDNFDRSQIHKFYEEIEKLRGLRIDAAFLPLDPRLGEEYWRGFDATMRLLQPMTAFPMHMIEDYDIINRFKHLPCTIPYRQRIAEITDEGQGFEI